MEKIGLMAIHPRKKGLMSSQLGIQRGSQIHVNRSPQLCKNNDRSGRCSTVFIIAQDCRRKLSASRCDYRHLRASPANSRKNRQYVDTLPRQCVFHRTLTSQIAIIQTERKITHFSFVLVHSKLIIDSMRCWEIGT